MQYLPNTTNGKKMKFLVLSALFPPNIIGGAERSAYNLSKWLASQGHEVNVITTAGKKDDEIDGKMIDGLRMWRISRPRPYPMINFQSESGLKKLLWHIQDHFDPRNRRKIREIITICKPDFINIHILQGIGYNVLKDVGQSGIPVNFFLHDLGLACIRMSMFKNGRECESQCALCRGSSFYKEKLLSQIDRLGFTSPSKANLDTLASYFPLEKYISRHILNANLYPYATEARVNSDALRLVYAGRIHASKGISLLLDVVDELAKTYAITLTIAGDGPDKAMLVEKYGSRGWVKFEGFVGLERLSNIFSNSDLLCIPSIWAENSPGVVIHGLSLGLPAIGSNKGGIPELIQDGGNGALVAPGDRQAWLDELKRLLNDRSILDSWRVNALSKANDFEQDSIGNKIISYDLEIMNLINKNPVKDFSE